MPFSLAVICAVAVIALGVGQIYKGAQQLKEAIDKKRQGG